jgi:hypothetical protein
MEVANLSGKILERVDAMDVDGFLTFLADDAQLRFGNGPAISGKQHIGQAIGEFFGSIKALRHKILHTWSDTRAIVCQGEVTYTRTNDTKVTIPFVNIWVVQADLIKDYLIYIDLAPLYV